MDSFLTPVNIAAFMSFFAAIASAIAAWRGPLSAAKLAETMRARSEQTNESRRMKLWIFTTLMQERPQLNSFEAVKALNLIDVVFCESMSVRDAWASLIAAYDSQNNIPTHVINDRSISLLREMASDIGISSTLRHDDFGRVYFPNSLMKERRIQELERDQLYERLSTQRATQSFESPNESPNTLSLHPPKPD